jgi:hypothetical protein
MEPKVGTSLIVQQNAYVYGKRTTSMLKRVFKACALVEHHHQMDSEEFSFPLNPPSEYVADAREIYCVRPHTLTGTHSADRRTCEKHQRKEGSYARG